jgi:molybdopterin molybdotransferase
LFDIRAFFLEILFMLELEQARERILDALQPLPTEVVSLNAAAGRVLAEPVLAPSALPAFDNSAMDGYAVRAEDLKEARKDAPVTLPLIARVAAGETPVAPLQPKTCIRLFTGSALPPGADAVVMQEDTRPAPQKPDQVVFLESIRPWENVRFRGEDVKRETQLFAAGERLNAGRIGLLAALGFTEAKVRQQPRVGLVATGSELLEAGEPSAPGKIYESNRITLGILLSQFGAVPRTFPRVPDNLAATCSALEKALTECDAVVTSGGVSVGEFDLVRSAFSQIGGDLEFWQVAIKPGKPFVFGRWREKFLFGLPGNPVSALVTFLLLVQPALCRWQGAKHVSLPAHPGLLLEPLTNHGDRRHFMRVTVDPQGQVRSAGVQASHMMSSLAKANGLVDVAPNAILPAGTTVPVLRWDEL